MVNYGRVKSSTRPEIMQVTATTVIISSNIEEYSEEIDGQVINGFEYDCVTYGKDEYLTTVAVDNAKAIADLQDELEATKILLGVE